MALVDILYACIMSQLTQYKVSLVVISYNHRYFISAFAALALHCGTATAAGRIAIQALYLHFGQRTLSNRQVNPVDGDFIGLSDRSLWRDCLCASWSPSGGEFSWAQ